MNVCDIRDFVVRGSKLEMLMLISGKDSTRRENHIS